jgi:hypothetical protein
MIVRESTIGIMHRPAAAYETVHNDILGLVTGSED